MLTSRGEDIYDRLVTWIRLGGYVTLVCSLVERLGWLGSIAATFAFIEVLRAVRRGHQVSGNQVKP